MSARIVLITPGSLIAVVCAVALSTLATTVIYASVSEGISESKQPLPVSVQRFQIQPEYQRTANFVGVVRASSDSALGFEVGGTLASVGGREGQRVTAGDILAVLDTDRRQAQLDAAAGELASIDAELELAALRRKRLEDLQAKGLASQEAYDEARLNLTALKASQKAVSARLRSAQLEIEKSTLRAPYTGVVAERFVQEGAVISPGTPVLRLVAAGDFEAHVGLPVDKASGLEIGTSHSLTTSGTTFPATLRAVRADVDPTTLTVGAVFDIPETATVYAGASLLLELTEQVASEGGWLPVSALIEGDRGLWNILVLAESDGELIAVREAVEVLASRGERAFVRGTLADGAEVIAAGVHRLSPGVPVIRAEGVR